MIYGEYVFKIRLTADAILPRYKGSTFRGVLGHALKRVVCALRHQPCDTCLLRSNCTYAMVFETRHAVTLPGDARISAPPHPMILEPPLTKKTIFRKGESLECRLILLGKINSNLSYFIYAFDQMGRLGIGKKHKGRRSGFELEQVRASNHVVYSSDTRMVVPPAQLSLLDLSGPSPAVSMTADGTDEGKGRGTTTPAESVMDLGLAFVTPMRMKRVDRRARAPRFQDLVRTMIRRFTALLNVYGQGEPSLDYAGLVRDAAYVVVKSQDVRWYDWQRYSSRQNRKMFMGGISGSVVYSGNLAPFLPFVDMAEKVHLGKNTQFGLGMVRRVK